MKDLMGNPSRGSVVILRRSFFHHSFGFAEQLW